MVTTLLTGLSSLGAGLRRAVTLRALSVGQ